MGLLVLKRLRTFSFIIINIFLFHSLKADHLSYNYNGAVGLITIMDLFNPVPKQYTMICVRNLVKCKTNNNNLSRTNVVFSSLNDNQVMH